MQRKQRNLDGESDEEGQEQPQLLDARQLRAARLERAQNRRVVEATSADPLRQIDDRDQHQYRAGHGVEKEFDGSVNAPVVSPDADQEVHGHQANFPEYIKEEEVECREDADQTEFQEQQESVELFGPLLHGAPRYHDRDGGEEGREQDQP